MMFRNSDGNVVEFYERPIQHRTMSDGQGRPIYWKQLVAKVLGPGMKNGDQHVIISLTDDQGNIVKKYPWRFDVNTGETVTMEQRFAEPLKAWRERTGGPSGNGTPLESWPRINDVATIAMLKASGIHMLETLAGVPDSNLHALGPNGRGLRDGAASFLQAAAGNAPIDKLSAENAEMKNEMEEMKRMVASLTAQLDQATAPETRKGK